LQNIDWKFIRKAERKFRKKLITGSYELTVLVVAAKIRAIKVAR
jgi:CRISPR/Cas system-associated protein endoribonuclease Cas2